MSLHVQPAVPAGSDVFWEPADGLPAPGSPPVRLVALTHPYSAGSAEEKTLQNMLAACKLGPTEFSILHLAPGQPLAWHRIREALQPAVVLLLGVSPDQLGIRAAFPPHVASRFDTALWIPTLALPELNARKDIRQALWTDALKPLFPGS